MATASILEKWYCPRCKHLNEHSNANCKACLCPHPPKSCPKCSYKNEYNATECCMCSTKFVDEKKVKENKNTLLIFEPIVVNNPTDDKENEEAKSHNPTDDNENDDMYPEFIETKPRNNFKIRIAIDFGTDGIALAYGLEEHNILIHTKWKTSRYTVDVKPKAVVLLDENKNVVPKSGFGKDAKYKYMITPEKGDKWMLFERFKMSLYESALKQTNMKIEDELTATNGKKVQSSVVFIAVFKHLKQLAHEYLRTQKVTRKMYKLLSDDEIQWIVTVPAIWNHTAKMKMRQWMIDAGLVNINVEDQSKIVYEPDCASLAIQYELKKIKNNKTLNPTDEKRQEYFKKNENYLLVDAGGGTVDIIVHQILSDEDTFGVKEVLHPTGGPWGSYYIDDEFVKLLKNIFSEEWIEEFKTQKPNEYTELLHVFQKQKHTFYKKPNATKHYIDLGLEFVSFIQDKLDEKNEDDDDKDDEEDVENVVESCKVLEKSKNTRLNDTVLELGVDIWKLMFDQVVQPTVSHIKNLLNNLTSKHTCNYLCLVGGLSMSPYFRAKMDAEFGPKSKYKLKLIKPQRPMLCVVQGAAYMGVTSNYIHARILKYSYGELLCWPEWYAIEQKVPDYHIIKHRYYNRDKKENWVSGCFEVIARKNEEIITGEAKKSKSRRKVSSVISTKAILCSELEYPKIEWDGVEIGQVKTKFKDDDLDMTLEFHFYDTIIKVISYRDNEPEKRQRHYIINELYQ